MPASSLKKLSTQFCLFLISTIFLVSCTTAQEASLPTQPPTVAASLTPAPTLTPMPTSTDTPQPTPTHTPVPPTATITPTEGPKVPLVVAAVSMPVVSDKAANQALFEKYMTDAAAQGVHLIVFPASAMGTNPGLGNWDYQPSDEEKAALADLAETIPGETTAWLTEKASQLKMYVIFGMIEKGQDGLLYDSSVFLGPQGVLGTYQKKTLADNGMGGNEHVMIARGKQPGLVVDSPLGKIGLLVGADTFAGYGYDLRKGKAHLVVTVADWSKSYAQYFEESTKKAATDCGCWHVFSNIVGPFGKIHEGIGHSRILNAKGEILVDSGEAEGMLVFTTEVMVDEAAITSLKE